MPDQSLCPPSNALTLASRLDHASWDGANPASLASELAGIARMLGVGDEGLATATNGGDADVLNVVANFLAGELLRREKFPSEAIWRFRRALAYDPQHAQSLHRMGNALKAVDRYRMSVTAYARAMVLDRNNLELLRQYGNALKDVGLFGEAGDAYLDLVRQRPNDALGYYSLATLERDEWRIGQARALSRKALVVQPDFAPAMLLFADIYKDECRLTESVRFLMRALLVNPLEKRTYMLLGMVLRETGQNGKAIEVLRMGASIAPGDEEILRELGVALADVGRVSEAAQVYRWALAIKPEFPSVKIAVGLMRLSHGGDGGVDAFLEALGLQPDLYALPTAAAEESVFRSEPVPVSPRVVVATSLMPKRVQSQEAAIKSWVALGFEVISVNGESELDELRTLFPDVRFVAARRTAEAICGRPLVLLDEILHGLERSGAPVCGIVNSDIVLKSNQGAVVDLVSRSQQALVFGNRMNVTDLDDQAGSLYRDGYDYFLFGRDMLSVFSGSEMVIGAPWWDYWMPMAAFLAGAKIHIPDSITALHQIHDLGYSKVIHRHFARVFVDETGRLSRQVGAVSGNSLRCRALRVLQCLSAARNANAWDPAVADNVGALGRFVTQTVRSAVEDHARIFAGGCLD